MGRDKASHLGFGVRNSDRNTNACKEFEADVDRFGAHVHLLDVDPAETAVRSTAVTAGTGVVAVQAGAAAATASAVSCCVSPCLGCCGDGCCAPACAAAADTSHRCCPCSRRSAVDVTARSLCQCWVLQRLPT